MDCSFISKSGKQTYGLDKFYNSKQGKAEKGLEISTLAIVDVDYSSAYNLSTRQTPVSSKQDETRVDQYLAHLQEDRAALPQRIRYLVADGYYSKTLLRQLLLWNLNKSVNYVMMPTCGGFTKENKNHVDVPNATMVKWILRISAVLS